MNSTTSKASDKTDQPFITKEQVLGALVAGVYCGAASLAWYTFAQVWYGDRGSGLILVFGVVASPVLALLGLVLGYLCIRFGWHRFGPLGPTIMAALFGYIANQMINDNNADLKLMLLALVLGLLGHYVVSFAGGVRGSAWIGSLFPRDGLQFVGAAAVALTLTGLGLMMSEQRTENARALANETAELSGASPSFEGSQGIRKVRDDPCSGVRSTYRYQTTSSSDFRPEAEEMAQRYADAGFELQRWVQHSDDESPEDATYVIYGVHDDHRGVKVFASDERLTVTVQIDCGTPFSLARGGWEDHTVDEFPTDV